MQHLPRVHDAPWVEGLLDVPHHGHGLRPEHLFQELDLLEADSVLAGAGASEVNGSLAHSAAETK